MSLIFDSTSFPNLCNRLKQTKNDVLIDMSVTKAEQGEVDLSKFDENKLESIEDKFSTNHPKQQEKKEEKSGGTMPENELPSSSDLLKPEEPAPEIKKPPKSYKKVVKFKKAADFRSYYQQHKRPKLIRFPTDKF